MSTPPVLSRARKPVGELVRSAGARVPSPSVSRLRAAVTALFVLDGAVFGSWAARVPDVATRVGADHRTLGLALLCLSLGALVSMRVTGGWCARFGAGPVSAVAAVAVSAGALLPGVYDYLVGPLLQRMAIANDQVPPTEGNVFESQQEGNATEGRWRSI